MYVEKERVSPLPSSAKLVIHPCVSQNLRMLVSFPTSFLAAKMSSCIKNWPVYSKNNAGQFVFSDTFYILAGFEDINIWYTDKLSLVSQRHWYLEDSFKLCLQRDK